ncbi:uncharacterized protein LOC119608731 isoform X10 [Lucilia sericata]|uniref:uncharacterized protein LOC119608731 isoform X10 n=1 Tax=Lucilia sericata TaxID=13632 RepID=UPI0018A7FBE0|nr:uncharacterized protein LOC119608731 isoform X10 [Lucilia sericata]
MDIFGIYILMFFILFLVMPIVYFILRVKQLWNFLIVKYRQGNNFATAEEAARDNRFNDIFFIEPNSPEAARIRAQLEKDDKDLPSYDEVMRMTNLSTPTAAPAAGAVNFVPAMPSALSMGASSSSVNTTDTTLTVPPYTSADPNVSSSSRPLTPPPYTPEPIGASVVLPITTPLHSQQPAQSS